MAWPRSLCPDELFCCFSVVIPCREGALRKHLPDELFGHPALYTLNFKPISVVIPCREGVQGERYRTTSQRGIAGGRGAEAG